jgi:SpoVK/Ycf46/Vps4 family AAA+-type ATPase
MSVPVFSWTSTTGLRRANEPSAIFGTTHLKGALQHISSSTFEAIYHLRVGQEELDNREFIDHLENAATKMAHIHGGILLTGPELEVPRVLQGHVARVVLPTPTSEEYKVMLIELVKDLSKTQKVKVTLTQGQANRLIHNLKGFTLLEAEKVLTKAIIVDNALSELDIQRVINAKTEIVDREGLLEYYPTKMAMADVAGLHGLKAWLNKRKALISSPKKAREFGLSFPKGVLLLGVPGTGKSLCAKAVSQAWSLPLLKMDPAALYNKYIGQTEENFRRAIQVAEKMSPVILWIDEIEKAFQSQGGEQDGGVSTRVLGTFLGWLQEREGDVFVVATANDVSKLPPELLRKGRLDEIFFLDLPDESIRKELFSIHLKKRGMEPEKFDLDAMVNASENFTGADIEQAIISALYNIFENKTKLQTHDVVKELEATRCLADLMPEKINALRQWARGRTVSADR